MVAGGDDYAEITVDRSITKVGMPFLPLAKHTIYDPAGTIRFVGWLDRPGRKATGSQQQQTYRLSGPNYLLNSKVFLQAWNYPVAPENYVSAVVPKMIPRVLLNRQDYDMGTAVNVAEQIQEILDFAKSPTGANLPISCGSLAAIPAVQPPEDEQTDAYCGDLVRRQLRLVPRVTASWSYSGANPQMIFSDNSAIAAGTVSGDGAVHLPPGVGLISAPGSGGIVIDLSSGTIQNFQSEGRWDLLVGKVTVFLQSEIEVTDDGSISGTRKVWATMPDPDVSTADNGSLREITMCIDLRGAGGPRDPVTGLPRTPQEARPTGLAAALHAQFKELTHSVQWKLVGRDVDWSTKVGFAVGVKNAGDPQLAGSRSIIQKITRDIGTGTTSYEAGPPWQLGLNDLVSMTRFNRSRNAARSGGGSAGGGYTKAGGPDQKKTGEKQLPSAGGTSGSLPARTWNVASNGLAATAQFQSTEPTVTNPPGNNAVNPP